MTSEQQVEAALKSYEDVDSWKTIIFLYNAALKEVGTKLEILNDEFQHVHQYNPIEHIKTRIKTPESIVKKLRRYGHETSIENMVRYINDIADKFGSQCVVVAIDAKKRQDGSGWNIYKNGGRVDVGIDAVEWAQKVEQLGAGEILLTSMDCDGTKSGYDLELTKAIAQSVSIPVIASGGAGKLEHFKDALAEGMADAALAASLFHYKELEIRQVKEYLAKEGVSVRL